MLISGRCSVADLAGAAVGRLALEAAAAPGAARAPPEAARPGRGRDDATAGTAGQLEASGAQLRLAAARQRAHPHRVRAPVRDDDVGAGTCAQREAEEEKI